MQNPLIVKKFGGTSVGTLERIEMVAAQLIKAKQQGNQLVVVVSAMSGETDRLLNLAYHLSSEPPARELATLITTGEQVSMALLAIALQKKGYRAKSYNGSQLAITTDNAHLRARILNIDTHKILSDLENDCIIIIAGFQGISQEGDVTALGRGGSDTSAVALACALQASECQIYTDVDGIYTADPRLVQTAHLRDKIDFKSMLALARLGSKVLQWRSVALAGKYQIPLRVLSSFKEGYGTLIHYTTEPFESPQFVGLSHQTSLKRWVITIENPTGNEMTQIAKQLAAQEITLEHIHQISVGQQLKMSVLINHEEQKRAEAVLLMLIQENNWQEVIESELARVALVGIGVRVFPWVTEKFLAVLEKQNIYIQECIYSESALSAIIRNTELASAAQALHSAFLVD